VASAPVSGNNGFNTLVAAKGTPADEYIDYVSKVVSITHQTLLDMVTLLLVGNLPYGSNTILFSAGFSFNLHTLWKIWIDYNQNGTLKLLKK
jgi:hypothetical protein